MFLPDLREQVSHKRHECDVVDAYFGIPWAEHKEPRQVDHVIEVQLMGMCVRQHPKGRTLVVPLRQAVNDVLNLNVTTAALNQAKGGRGGIFDYVTKDLRLQKEVRPIEDYVLQAVHRVTRLQKRTLCTSMGEGVVSIWNSRMESRINEVDAELAERVDDVLTRLFYKDAKDGGPGDDKRTDDDEDEDEPQPKGKTAGKEKENKA